MHFQRILLALALGAGQRGLQRLLRRGLVAALAALVEIHRRAVQARQHGGGFHRRRHMAIVIAAKIGKGEIVFAAAFPEEIHVEGVRLFFHQRHEFRQRGLLETQHHGGRFDFRAFAVGRFDL